MKLNNLAVLLEEKGSLQEALTLIEKALVLEPEDTLYTNNWNRIKKKGEDIQQSYFGNVWSQLSDIQKQLLYLVNENKASDWSYLIQQLREEEPQLKESWEVLIGCGALMHADGRRATVERSLLPLVSHNGQHFIKLPLNAYNPARIRISSRLSFCRFTVPPGNVYCKREIWHRKSLRLHACSRYTYRQGQS